MKKKLFFYFLLNLFAGQLYSQKSIEDSLNKVIAENKDEAEVAKAYNSLAYEYSRKDLVKSRNYLDAAIAICKRIKNYKRLSSSYSQLVYFLHDVGKPDSAEYYIGQVKNLYDQAEGSEKDDVGSNYYTVGALYYRRTGAYQKAVPFFENAIALNKKRGDKESTAGQTLNLGNNYISMSNYKKAAENHLKALALFEELGNQRGISFCYQGLSKSFTELKQYNQALVYVNNSIKIKTVLKDRKGLGSSESTLGDIYRGLGDLDKSLTHYNNAVVIAKEVKSLPEEMGNYQNIAQLYKEKKDFKLALDYFNQSKELAKQLKDSSSVAAMETEILALQTAKKTDADEQQLNKNQELFKERGDLGRQAEGYKNMVEFYVTNKNFEKALEYNNKYHEVNDSIRSADLQMQIIKMEEGYTSAKKESEIQLLKKDGELQQQKISRQRIIYGAALGLLLISLAALALFINRNKLKQRMKELELRNQIAADLHDEVGSSLSSIHMLSQMAAQPGTAASRKDDILQRMSGNAKETMEKMSDLIWTIKPEAAEGSNLKQRMERFSYEICGSKNIDLTLELDKLDEKDLTMEQRKTMYLIFKEALNNAVKYSGTEKISVSAANGNNVLTMIVKDEGKGFDIGTVLKGNGLENIKARAAGVGGKLAIDSIPGNGTTVKLTMPLTN
ncbi:MAG: sensor histidine kinase [Chitinophagaceae bacterium]|nr:sensor histidine kinase [Chitinophagaceae bacterium]